MRRHLLLADALAWPLLAKAGRAKGAATLTPSWLDDGFAAHVARHGPDAAARDVGALIWGPGGVATRALGPTPSLVSYLRWLAGALLWRDGDEARLHMLQRERFGGSVEMGSPLRGAPGEELLLWRAVSLQVQPELLLAALGEGARGADAASAGVGCPARRVCLLPPLLRSPQRTAHLHLHLGQVTSSAHAWAAPPATVRRALDRAAARRGQPDAFLGVEELWLRARLLERRWAVHAAHHLGPMQACAACGDPDFIELTAELAEGVPRVPSPEARAEANAAGLRLLEGAAAVLGAPAGDVEDVAAHPERLTAALATLLDHDPPTPGRPPRLWDRAVAQLLRARALLHRRVVLDPARPGLRDFRLVEQDAKTVAPKPSAAALREHGGARWLDVGAIELRAASGNARSLLQRVQELGERRELAAEVGWVAAFSRSMDRLPDPAEPQAWSAAFFARGHEVVQAGRALIQAVEAAEGLGQRPLRALRGLDLVGDERRGPLWLFRPALAAVRRALDGVAAHARTRAPGLTVHCGEDFGHLLSGLRAVHEPLRCGLWRQGDRLGHALALGLEPARWAQGRSAVPMRALERALDLVWARGAAAHLGVDLSGAELLRMDAELDALAQALLPSCTRGDDRGQALIKLDRELWLLSADDLDALRSRGDRPAEVGGRLPTLCALVDAGHLSGGPWIEVPVGGAGGCEVGLIERLSTALARELASQQVVVEVNPSSNLLVAGLHAPLAQERLWTRGLAPDQTGAVPICLSADDPMVFATALEDEVAYAWAGMVVAGGLSATYARGWIEDALGVAWRARFTLPSA